MPIGEWSGTPDVPRETVKATNISELPEDTRRVDVGVRVPDFAASAMRAVDALGASLSDDRVTWQLRDGVLELELSVRGGGLTLCKLVL
jgi:hypothetical protein